MLKFFILGGFFLIGLNASANFFIKDQWIHKNNVNYLIYLALLAFVDFFGIYFMVHYLVPAGWPACLQGLSFWWC